MLILRRVPHSHGTSRVASPPVGIRDISKHAFDAPAVHLCACDVAIWSRRRYINDVYRQPRRIDEVDRIVPHVPIQVELVLVPDGIGLHEPAERGRVHPRLVVVHAELGQPRLPGVLEPAGVAGAGDAVFVVAVDADAAGVRIGGRDDRAALVGVEILARAVGDAGAVEPHQWIVACARPVDIAPDDRARAAVLEYQRIPVVEERRVPVGAGAELVNPPERIVAHGRGGDGRRGRGRLGFGPRHQAILDVVDVGVGHRHAARVDAHGLREVAVQIVSEAREAVHRGVLVEPVRGVIAVDGGLAVPGVQVLGPRAAGDLGVIARVTVMRRSARGDCRAGSHGAGCREERSGEGGPWRPASICVRDRQFRGYCTCHRNSCNSHRPSLGTVCRGSQLCRAVPVNEPEPVRRTCEVRPAGEATGAGFPPHGAGKTTASDVQTRSFCKARWRCLRFAMAPGEPLRHIRTISADSDLEERRCVLANRHLTSCPLIEKLDRRELTNKVATHFIIVIDFVNRSIKLRGRHEYIK